MLCSREWLLSVHFVDPTTGWAVDLSGMIHSTTDGGNRWTTDSAGQSQWLPPLLYSGHFVNATTGWVVGLGSRMLSTTDGGKTWTDSSRGTTEKQ